MRARGGGVSRRSGVDHHDPATRARQRDRGGQARRSTAQHGHVDIDPLIELEGRAPLSGGRAHRYQHLQGRTGRDARASRGKRLDHRVEQLSLRTGEIGDDAVAHRSELRLQVRTAVSRISSDDEAVLASCREDEARLGEQLRPLDGRILDRHRQPLLQPLRESGCADLGLPELDADTALRLDQDERPAGTERGECPPQSSRRVLEVVQR